MNLVANSVANSVSAAAFSTTAETLDNALTIGAERHRNIPGRSPLFRLHGSVRTSANIPHHFGGSPNGNIRFTVPVIIIRHRNITKTLIAEIIRNVVAERAAD